MNPALDMFRRITYGIIKARAPKEYHQAFEWEYEGKKNTKTKLLRVWLDDDRQDEPFLYELNGFERQLVDVAYEMLEPDMVSVPIEDMD
jgi:hypothetical protein